MKEEPTALGSSSAVRRTAKIWVLGVDAHEQVLSLAEIQTNIEHHTVMNSEVSMDQLN